MNQDAAVNDSAGEGSGAVLNADRAIICCLAAWGGSDSGAEGTYPWRWFAPAWRARLLATKNRDNLPGPREALSLLRRSHRLQGRAQPAAVHPGWYARALQDESPAVRQWIATRGLVKTGATLSAAPAATTAVATEPNEPGGDHRFCASPEVAGWVLTLWTERLLGGEPVGADEPPVIVALASLSSRRLYRLAHAAGLAKAVLAGDTSGLSGDRSIDRQRVAWLRDQFLRFLGPQERQPQSWARTDLARPIVTGQAGRHRRLATLGLITLARLLEGCQPYRARWALQHVPYPISKRIRALLAQNRGVKAPVRALEATILKTAWQRLAIEGQIAIEHPQETMRTGHAR
jgi:hypothetical protein